MKKSYHGISFNCNIKYDAEVLFSLVYFLCFQLSFVPCVHSHYLPLILFASSSFASSFSYLFHFFGGYFLTLTLENILFFSFANIITIYNTQIWQIKECVLTIMLCIVIVFTSHLENLSYNKNWARKMFLYCISSENRFN